MLTYKKSEDGTIGEIVVDGKITDEDMVAALTAIRADLDGGSRLKLLEDVRSLAGIEPSALFKDPRFGFAMMRGVTHVALVTDAIWLRALARGFDLVSLTRIKAFRRQEVDVAREWLNAAI